MGITTSKLRQNIYKLLDQVAETGEPLEKRDVIVGDAEELVHIDWSSEWSQKPI